MYLICFGHAGFQTGKPHPQIPQIRYEQIQQTLGKRKGDITDEDANAEILKRLRSENGASAELSEF